MQTTILWEGIALKSLEHCCVTEIEAGTLVEATIVGHTDNNIYKVNYRLTIDEAWHVTSAFITGRIGKQGLDLQLKSEATGIWRLNGKSASQLDGCLDIDISLTPFINTLAINRLHLSYGERREITVIYFDLLDGIVRPARQAYTKLSERTYKYENVPNDFSADISLNEQMLVLDYPELFRQIKYMPE